MEAIIITHQMLQISIKRQIETILISKVIVTTIKIFLFSIFSYHQIRELIV